MLDKDRKIYLIKIIIILVVINISCKNVNHTKPFTVTEEQKRVGKIEKSCNLYPLDFFSCIGLDTNFNAFYEKLYVIDVSDYQKESITFILLLNHDTWIIRQINHKSYLPNTKVEDKLERFCQNIKTENGVVYNIGIIKDLALAYNKPILDELITFLDDDFWALPFISDNDLMDLHYYEWWTAMGYKKNECHTVRRLPYLHNDSYLKRLQSLLDYAKDTTYRYTN